MDNEQGFDELVRKFISGKWVYAVFLAIVVAGVKLLLPYFSGNGEGRGWVDSIVNGEGSEKGIAWIREEPGISSEKDILYCRNSGVLESVGEEGYAAIKLCNRKAPARPCVTLVWQSGYATCSSIEKFAFKVHGRILDILGAREGVVEVEYEVMRLDIRFAGSNVGNSYAMDMGSGMVYSGSVDFRYSPYVAWGD